MLDKVADRMRHYESKKGEKQSCHLENFSFTKKLFFNPGHPVDQSDSSQSQETGSRLNVGGLESAQTQNRPTKQKKSSIRLFVNTLLGKKYVN